MFTRGVCVGGVIWTCLLAASPAFGDNAVPTASSAQIKAGAQASKEKKWDACVTAYTAALESDESPSIFGELGLCEEHAGRFADAYRHLHRALEKAPSPPIGEPWSRYQAAATRVFKRVALVYITSNPTKVDMMLDGQPIGRADGRGIAVEPGTHTLAGHLDGYEDQSEPFTVSAGDVPNVHLELRPKPPNPATVPTPSVPTSTHQEPVAPPFAVVPWYEPAWSPRGVLVPIAVLPLGAAVVGAVTWGALEADRVSLRSKLGSSSCGPDAAPLPAACTTLHQRVEQRDVAMGITIGGVATAGILVGVSRLLFGVERAASSPRVAPVVSGDAAGIAVLGAW